MIKTYTGVVREWQPWQKPREKFLTLGAAGVSTVELLAILLRTGRQGSSVLDLAKEVLDTVSHGAYGLNDTTVVYKRLRASVAIRRLPFVRPLNWGVVSVSCE